MVMFLFTERFMILCLECGDTMFNIVEKDFCYIVEFSQGAVFYFYQVPKKKKRFSQQETCSLPE